MTKTITIAKGKVHMDEQHICPYCGFEKDTYYPDEGWFCSACDSVGCESSEASYYDAMSYADDSGY